MDVDLADEFSDTQDYRRRRRPGPLYDSPSPRAHRRRLYSLNPTPTPPPPPPSSHALDAHQENRKPESTEATDDDEECSVCFGKAAGAARARPCCSSSAGIA